MHTSALAAVLTTAALAAPTAAAAMPQEPIPPPTQTAPRTQIRQDLGSPDARDAAKGRYIGQGRSHGKARIYVPPSQLAAASEQAAASSGSTQTQPSTPAPAVHVGEADNGIDWATVALGIGGSMLAVSGIAAFNNRRNRRRRAIPAAH